MTIEKFEDDLGRIWRRHGNGIYFGLSAPGSWVEPREGRFGRAYADGRWIDQETSTLWSQARNAWAALIPAIAPTIEPTALTRPETVEIAGLVWFRSHGGIDSGAANLDSYVGFRAGVLGRIWPPEYSHAFTPYHGPSWDAHAANIRKAWEILIGDWPGTLATEPASGEHCMGVALKRLAQRRGAGLAPVHHWSFRCAPDRLDVARIFTEMAALGVSRERVSITIRARGKRSIRVAVHSGVGR